MISMTFKNFHTRKYTIRKIKRQGEDICKPIKVTYQCVEYLKIPYKSVRKDKQQNKKGAKKIERQLKRFVKANHQYIQGH